MHPAPLACPAKPLSSVRRVKRGFLPAYAGERIHARAAPGLRQLAQHRGGVILPYGQCRRYYFKTR